MKGQPEIVDVSAVYVDRYRRVGNQRRFAERIEHTHSITGGRFADLIALGATFSSRDRHRES